MRGRPKDIALRAKFHQAAGVHHRYAIRYLRDYKVLLASKMNTSQALEKLKSEADYFRSNSLIA